MLYEVITSLEAQLSEARTREELMAVRQELSASFAPRKQAKKGAPRKDRGPGKEPRAVPPQVEQIDFRGYTILLGRNNTGNRITSYNVCYTKLLRTPWSPT